MHGAHEKCTQNFSREPEGKRLGRSKRRRKDIKTGHKEIKRESMNYILRAQDSVQWRILVNTVMNFLEWVKVSWPADRLSVSQEFNSTELQAF
jgi:hypothetical protein